MGTIMLLPDRSGKISWVVVKVEGTTGNKNECTLPIIENKNEVSPF